MTAPPTDSPKRIARKIKKAKIIACPGCYATAILLGLIPLIQGGVIKNHGIIADAKSGVSGAGKKSGRDDLLFADMFGNFKAYSVGGHRHEAEMIQSLAEFCGANSQMIFIPHLLPTARGIYATLYCPAEKKFRRRPRIGRIALQGRALC